MYKVNKIPILVISNHSDYENPIKIRVYLISVLQLTWPHVCFIRVIFDLGHLASRCSLWNELHHAAYLCRTAAAVFPLREHELVCNTNSLRFNAPFYQLLQWVWYKFALFPSSSFALFFLPEFCSLCPKDWIAQASYITHLCEHSLRVRCVIA